MQFALDTRIILFTFLCCVSGFMPEPLPGNFDNDFSQREIVFISINNFLDQNFTAQNVDDILNSDSLLEDFRNLAMIRQLEENASSIVQRIDKLADFTITSGLEHVRIPAWSFSDENIREGHTLILNLRRQFIASINEDPPDFNTCQKLIGQIFHLIQSFYSNTNWVENHPGAVCKELGLKDELPYSVAPLDVSTCKICGNEKNGCRDNLLHRSTLTSGYWSRTIDLTTTTDFKKWQEMSPDLTEGKCRHGGMNDYTHTPNTVPGGINKMSSNPDISPHYFLHTRAAVLAVLHCTEFLNDPETGLAREVGKEKIDRLLGVLSDIIYVYVDMAMVLFEQEKLEKSMQLYPNMNILRGITLLQVCRFSQRNLLIVLRIESEMMDETLPEGCNHGNTHIYHIIPDFVKERRPKRALTTAGMNLYNIIAQVSGGSVYVTSKTDIGTVVDLIKETVSAKPPVSIMKFLQKTRSSNTFTIPVDELMDNVTIKIQSTTSSVPVFNLYRPGGTKETFTNPLTATKQSLGTRLVVVKLINPDDGLWKFTRISTVEFEIEISAKTDLDFTYKFMQTGPGGFGEYPLVGRPIAGANTSVQVSVPLYDKVKSVDSIVVLDETGSTVSKQPLQNVGGRRGKSLFKTHIMIPSSEFKFAVEGKDKASNLFRRLDPRIISTLAIKLEVLGVSGTLYVNTSVTLTYRVTNVGGGSTKVVVKISDDKGFSQIPVSCIHSLARHQNETGKFTIKAGPVKGETVTVTVSANAEGAPANKVQYSVQRLTVEENITRAVDSDSPMCNVTKTVGTCNIGTDLCTCVNKTWSMEAEIGDVGFGLQSLFVNGAGNMSKFHYDNFSTGHTVDRGIIKASLTADCCHQTATITVVDLAGNVGLCNVTITPNFVAPDPKLCVNPASFNSSSNGGNKAIQCTKTHISGPCDLRNVSCHGSSCSPDTLCRNMTWKMRTQISNHLYAIHQIIPVNVGHSAQLVRSNDTLELIVDCCHPTAYISIIDIAGNVGHCHGNTSVLMNPIVSTTSSPTSNDGSSTSSLPVPIIAGAIGGGVVVISGAVIGGYLVKKHVVRKVTSVE